MRLSKLILLVFPIVVLTACGGSDEYEYTHSDGSYIGWAESINGTLVVDATDDVFEFEINTGYLHFGNTTYTNVWVDAYGDLYIDAQLEGSIYYVESVDHEIITALISNNGYYIDFYGPESDLAWTESLITPIYALQTQLQIEPKLLNTGSIYKQTAQQGKENLTASTPPPLNKRNVYSENLPENNISMVK